MSHGANTRRGCSACSYQNILTSCRKRAVIGQNVFTSERERIFSCTDIIYSLSLKGSTDRSLFSLTFEKDLHAEVCFNLCACCLLFCDLER